MSARLILVGRVAGAFGVKGEVRITAYTADPLALTRYGPLLREDGSAALVVTSARSGKGPEIVVRVQGVADKDAADALRGRQLYVPRHALPSPEDADDFYQADLIGLPAHDPAGEAVGVVKAVHDFGAGDVLEIEPGGGRPSFLVAFTRETVPTIDLASRRIVLVRPNETDADKPESSPPD